MQRLPGVELLQQARQVGVGQRLRAGDVGEAGRDVVAGFVGLIAVDGERQDLPEERGVKRGRGT